MLSTDSYAVPQARSCVTRVTRALGEGRRAEAFSRSIRSACVPTFWEEKYQCRLKNCTARSCFCAAASDLNVPRLRRLPLFGSFFREYSRYSPDLSLRIIVLY